MTKRADAEGERPLRTGTATVSLTARGASTVLLVPALGQAGAGDSLAIIDECGSVELLRRFADPPRFYVKRLSGRGWAIAKSWKRSSA